MANNLPFEASGRMEKTPELIAVSLGGAEGMQRVSRDMMGVFATRQCLEIGV